MLQSSLNKMDGVEAVKGFYSLDPQDNAILGALIQGYFFVVSAGALPLRMILRKNLGERSFSIFGFIVSISFYIYYGILLGGAGVITLTSKLFGGVDANWLDYARVILLNPFLIFMAIVIIRAVQHFKKVMRKAQNNQVQYSYFRGDGIFFRKRKGGKKWGFEIDERFMRMVIEPLAVLKIGLLILFIAAGAVTFNYFYVVMTDSLIYLQPILIWTAVLGLVLVLSAIFLFLEEFGIMMRIRGAVLDLIDADIDMQMIMKRKAEMAAGDIGVPDELIDLPVENTPMGDFLATGGEEVAFLPELVAEKERK